MPHTFKIRILLSKQKSQLFINSNKTLENKRNYSILIVLNYPRSIKQLFDNGSSNYLRYIKNNYISKVNTCKNI